MKSLILSTLTLLLATLTHAQERCDVPSPAIFCNTTEVLQYESSSCTPFHIFLSRGSDEPYPGRLGNITSEICATIGGTKACGFESIQYPAKSTAWGVDVWCKSAAKGAANGQAQMKAYSEKCPDAKLILLGFSQGGAVAQDVLGGGGGQVFACDQATNPALDASKAPGANIVAAVTFGAVVRNHGQNFTIGEGVNYDGRRARTPEQLAALNKYSDVLLDYCHYGDPMCAVGSEPESVEQHLNYFVQHNPEVIEWVAKMAKASEKGETVGKPSSSKSHTSSVVSSSSAKATATASASKAANNFAAASGTQAQATQSVVSEKTGAAAALGVHHAGVAVMVALVSAVML
ncbi:hypothetical protein N0V83_001622 [Neocucurbitaria cava]|uniref:Carbohydrate esterase family 5 protein n=1 Tax=Neocucurbitaria cava TaxID=798079 RepID=A0A9W8YGE5_9PLEO|nr:hypothetical protein N0V83_001622 [Neocucurbitaria cava]